MYVFFLHFAPIRNYLHPTVRMRFFFMYLKLKESHDDDSFIYILSLDDQLCQY